MTGRRIAKRWFVSVFVALVGLSVILPLAASARPQGPASDPGALSFWLDDDKPAKSKRPKKKKKSSKRQSGRKPAEKIRWGQQANESDEEYDKRFSKLLKRIRRDAKGDYNGGQFLNEKGEEIQLWTYMGRPFIVRTDIGQEFTAQTVMYMEMLHREFGAAYKKLLRKTTEVTEPVEIIVFADRGAYRRAGGQPSSGGQFAFATHFQNDRGSSWPAAHFRMMQFTDGISDFAKWPKDVLKHESCHMELSLRLGFKLLPRSKIAFLRMPPIWWNEGQAGVFEYWDFRKSVEENFEEIPERGRYVPMVRRMYGTDEWKDFDFFWTIDVGKWNSGGPRVVMNYAQGWSIVAYMMTGGTKGKQDFCRIFDLSMRVGTNDPNVSFTDRKVEYSRAWAEIFPPQVQEELSKNWDSWIRKHVPKEGAPIEDEEYYLRKEFWDASVKDELRQIDKEKLEENKKWVEKEDRRRRKSKVVEW